MTMADAKDQASGPGPDIPVHPWVAKLHPDPDVPTDLVALVGFPGPSRETGKVRLYTDLTFRAYIEIPREAVALAEPTDRQDENSPTRLHVRASTQLDVVQTSTETVAASFFQGAVASTLLAGAAATAAAGVVLAGTLQEPTAFHKCPTWPLFCPTNVIKCPTGNICWGAAQAAVAPTANCARQATLGSTCVLTIPPHCHTHPGFAVPVGAAVQTVTPYSPVGGAGPVVFQPACALHTIHIQTQGCPPCFTNSIIWPSFNIVQCTTFCTQANICQSLVFGCPGFPGPPLTDPTGVGG
jgi:hypothetical protein